MQNRFAPVVRRIDPAAELTGSRRLTGGMSAQITVLDVTRRGEPEKLVVREYGPKNRAVDPTPGRTESSLLRHLQAFDFPVPEPVLADDSGTVLDGPYAVVGYVDGAGPSPYWSDGLAAELITTLTRLHRLPIDHGADVTAPAEPLSLPRYADRVDRWLQQSSQPDEAMRETKIRTELGSWWPDRTELDPCILHGDFWPGNTVWRNDTLLAVIDWEDAAFGDPRSDLANLRLEVLWAYGQQAADDITHRYARAMPEVDISDQPYWDLVAATRPVGRLDEWGLAPDRFDVHLARFQHFVDTALRQITR